MGGKPLPGQHLGQGGHTRDKDGLLATVIFSELVAYAKSKGKSLIELLDEKVYLDPDIGFYVTLYEPSPYWGQFEGPTGLSKKIEIMRKLDKLREDFENGKELVMAGHPVVSVERYAAGKYDALHNWKGFPEEGIRFFFDKEKKSFLTVRPSGTSHCLRFHMQMHADVNKENLLEKKLETTKNAKAIVAHIRKLVGA
jgi:phosphoglucomutase